MFKEFKILLLKAKFHILKIIRSWGERIILDFLHISSHNFPNLIKDEFLTVNKSLFLNQIEFSAGSDFKSYLDELCKCYLKHEFNFLGSGWNKVKKTIVENNINEILQNRCLKQNVRISGKILDIIWDYNKDYEFIDWQIDFINNYLWSEKTLSKKLKYVAGADIKIPWELGRSQHLPQIALYYYLKNNSNDASTINQKARVLNEFKTQILDFIVFNPPKYGTQWYHSMDVGIRISNWLLAYDILKQTDAHFEHEFLNIFSRSIYQHGNHIYHNLERYINKRANHYFADLIGLLFICYYLPQNRLTDKWLRFALFSFIEEFDFQFFDDGGNIEGSTAYHRLVSEFVLWGSVIIEKLPNEILDKFHKKLSRNIKLSKYISTDYPKSTPGLFFSSFFFGKLKSVYQLLKDVTKPDGTAWLIGDNDNGRLFKFTVGKELFSSKLLIEYICDSPHFNDTIALFDGIFGEKNISCSYYSIETNIILSVAPKIIHTTEQNTTHSFTFYYPNSLINELQVSSTNRIDYKIILNLNSDNLEKILYPDFGIYVYKSKSYFLGIRCGGLVKNNITGHRHADQMCVEVYCNNSHIIRDPGMPTYTANPALRDYYRSARAHFIPAIFSDESNKTNNLFNLEILNLAECLYLDKNFFLAKWQLKNKIFYRMIHISEDTVKITDYIKSSEIYSEGQISSIKTVNFSPAYGIISERNSILIQTD